MNGNKESAAAGRSDHDAYAVNRAETTPTTSGEISKRISCSNNKTVTAPRLASALDALWKMKMKSMEGTEKRAGVPLLVMRKMRPKRETVDENEKEEEGGKETLVNKDNVDKTIVKKETVNGTEPDLLDPSAPAYAPAATPQQYEFSATMEYQPIHTNSTAYPYADNTNYPSYYPAYAANVHSPSQYLQHGSNSPLSAEDDHTLANVSRASPATLQWLVENYEPSDSTSLPRCTLYEHYKKHCNQYKLDPVNAASFGKLIRNVFQNLKTRRLGTRGNSKYHYYGIRIKPGSSLNTERHHENHYGNHVTPVEPVITTRNSLKGVSTGSNHSNQRTSSNSPVSYNPPVVSSNLHRMQSLATDTDRASIGAGEVPMIDLDLCFLGLENEAKKVGLNLSHIGKFVEGYKLNCSDVLFCAKNVQFDMIEEIWSNFWQPEDCDDESDISGKSSADRLSQQQLFTICTLPQILNFVISMDIAFYQILVDVLVPDVLMSEMTPMLTQACRSFAKNAEGYLRKAMQGAPETLQKKKIQAVKYMAQGLRRYTSLNHLAQAAKAVLQKQEQVVAMHNDYVKVDIAQVQEQAGWVCGCDSMLISQIHKAFQENLQKMAPMSHWAEWMESIVDQNVQILSNYHGKPVEEVMASGKRFLLNWSYYTSMMIRDLTLRSAGSFGSFHLIRLLTDEFMVYLVETKMSKVLSRPMIAVIAQPSDHPIFEESSPPSALPSISLNSNYMSPQDHSIFAGKYMGAQLMDPQALLDHNGDMMSDMQSPDGLL